MSRAYNIEGIGEWVSLNICYVSNSCCPHLISSTNKIGMSCIPFVSFGVMTIIYVIHSDRTSCRVSTAAVSCPFSVSLFCWQLTMISLRLLLVDPSVIVDSHEIILKVTVPTPPRPRLQGLCLGQSERKGTSSYYRKILQQIRWTTQYCNIYIYIYVIFYTCTNAYNSAVKWHWPLIHQTLFCFLTSESSRRSLFTDPAVSNCGVNWKNKNVKNAKIPSPMSPPSGSHSPVAGETTTNPCSGDQNPASP